MSDRWTAVKDVENGHLSRVVSDHEVFSLHQPKNKIFKLNFELNLIQMQCVNYLTLKMSSVRSSFSGRLQTHRPVPTSQTLQKAKS